MGGGRCGSRLVRHGGDCDGGSGGWLVVIERDFRLSVFPQRINCDA